MRYVSPSGRLAGPEAAFEGGVTRSSDALERAREWMGGGRFWSAVFVLLITISVAKSTATAPWVDGLAVITPIAIIGAVLLTVLAILPVREPIALGIGAVLAPVAAVIGAWPQLHARHPTDVIGPQLIGTWWSRINDGTASSDPSFYLFLICLLMWVAGAWLGWCVLRWRKPMLGLIPGAAAFATNLLNFPADQNGYTLAMLVLTLGLLLWTNYTGSIANAARARVKLTGDARWDFWESGLVAMAALIVLAIMLPPIPTVDRTVDMESSAFSSWAQLLQTLSHPGALGTGAGGSGATTGFSPDVLLNSSLHRTHQIVFTYTVAGDFVGPHYFRGVNETLLWAGAWRYQENNSFKEAIASGQSPPYAE